MHRHRDTTRRTVLKTITTAAVGSLATAGAATATNGGPHGTAHGVRNDVEIVARHDHDADEHTFELSADRVPGGWTTLTLDNRTSHTHFAYLQKVPDAAIAEAAAVDTDLLDYWIEQITDPFQVFMDWILGEAAAPPAFPAWFGQIEPRGGPGLTAGNTTSRTTVWLDPGIYQVECYVKDADNVFHSAIGMAELLEVTAERSRAPEPEPTLQLSLSTTDGLVAPDTVRPGRHTVAVRFDDQQAYSHLLGHDVHLVRLEGDTTVADVNGWMDWTNAWGTSGNQLVSDGSEPTRFLGGVHEIWTGEFPATGYLHATLTPGDYAWVAEVPDPVAHGLLETFTVPHGQQTGRQ